MQRPSTSNTRSARGFPKLAGRTVFKCTWPRVYDKICAYMVKAIALIIVLSLTALPAHAADDGSSEAAEPETKGLDMVSDTVASVFNKTNALLRGNLEITMSKDGQDTGQSYTTNAIGQRVPSSTAVKSAGSLHNDEPL